MPFRKGLSLHLAGRFALALVGLYVVLASIYSAQFLNRVETGAGLAREQQIPLILSQNRNALKVERAASLIRSVYLAHDRRVERQVQLQLQTLTQSFTLDDNQALTDGGRQIAASVKQITVQRETARELRAGTFAQDQNQAIRLADSAATEAYQRAIQTTEILSDNLSRDAVQLADGLASTIEQAARDVRFGWLFILTLPAVFLILVFWVVSRHILRPITGAISNLNGLGQKTRRPLFAELRTVADAVEAFHALSLDLKRTNEMLLVLSDHDGLTGLLNRRAFEQKLDKAFRHAQETSADLSVFMIDLDHFKSINDTHGHEAGDACLRSVSEVLKIIALRHGLVLGRYGGEEFCAFLEADSAHVERIGAELREFVEALSIETGDRQKIAVTASIGVSSWRYRQTAGLADLVGEADKALYRAKRAGRNVVVRFRKDNANEDRLICG
jgi:diguanylate cyclase (GGDEF)-like protein